MKLVSEIDQALRDLREKLGAIPFVSDVGLSRSGRGASSETLHVTTPEGPRRIEIEVRGSGEPRHVREASFVLSDRERSHPGAYGVIVAPYLSPDARAILRRQGQGWSDAAGNCFVSFAGLHIDIEKANTNPFISRRQHKSIFSPKSGRILKVLLMQGSALKGNDIAERAQVSPAQVSKIRQLLLDREWAVTDAAGLRIVQPLAVLSAWRDERPAPTLIGQGYTTHHGRELDALLETMFAQDVATPQRTLLLASHSMARRMAPYARTPGEFFYADRPGIDTVTRHLNLSLVQAGANVFFYEPDDDAMQLDSIELSPSHLRGTGLIQTYLDLSAMSDRDREAADYLLEQKLAPVLKAGNAGASRV